MSLNDNTSKIAAILAKANALPDRSEGVALDTTLTQSGKAADAKAVGDALAGKQPKGDYLTQADLQTATNEVLAQAKASGEFDGADGTTPHIGDNGNWFVGSDDTGKPSRGAKGDKGEPGSPGAKGDKGDKGDTGATPNITIGTVTTLEAGQNATASMGGTAESPVLNLGIPKGAKGEPGQDGSVDIATSVSPSSTDYEVPSAKAVYTFVTQKVGEIENGTY